MPFGSSSASRPFPSQESPKGRNRHARAPWGTCYLLAQFLSPGPIKEMMRMEGAWRTECDFLWKRCHRTAKPGIQCRALQDLSAWFKACLILERPG